MSFVKPRRHCTTAKAVCWLIEVLLMSRLTPKIVRRRFFVAAGHALHLTWPVLSIILAFQFALGLLIGFLEGWSFGEAVYFTFITGLTIGYGDIVPRQALARALAVGIGVSGLFLTGLIAGIAVYAMRAAIDDRDSC
jgi:voltage-gated potassium channel